MAVLLTRSTVLPTHCEEYITRTAVLLTTMAVLPMRLIVSRTSLVLFFLRMGILSIQFLILRKRMILFSSDLLILPLTFVKIPGRMFAMKEYLIVSPGLQRFIYTLLRNMNELIRLYSELFVPKTDCTYFFTLRAISTMPVCSEYRTASLAASALTCAVVALMTI